METKTENDGQGRKESKWRWEIRQEKVGGWEVEKKEEEVNCEKRGEKQ